ncbi:MAG TPA: Gfo/Idh/MocA family oxidoreductase [Candidatus Saccharimonadales bacterium]|nr:Gfo/Idh/MocA family oxidoreductase [Candidatus Saccharimonadales bacterium]
MTALRWGILSTADIGTGKVIPGMRRAARTEVVAIASRDVERGRNVADRLGIPTVHDGYEALLADPNVDAVYIPLPNHLHPEWTIAAVEAGKHVLCEKPLAMTSAAARRMVDAATAKGVILVEAFMYRLHPSWLAVRELVASGRIGRVVAVHTVFAYYNDDATNIRNIRAYGGGALYDIGCYCINVARMVFGSEPTAVHGAIRRDALSGVDVLTSGLLEFGDDGVATFTCGIRMESDQRVEIYGSEGRITVEIPFNIPPDRGTRIIVTAGGDPPVAPATEILDFATKDPYAAEVEAFAAAVLDGAPPPIPADDAVANLRVIERVVAAAEDGRSA